MRTRILELIQQLIPQLQTPPVKGSLPLMLLGKWAGFIWPDALKQLQGHPLVRCHDGYVEIIPSVLNDENLLLAESQTQAEKLSAATHPGQIDNNFSTMNQHSSTPDYRALSISLNQIAHELRASGCLPFWRDEQVHAWAEGEKIAHLERTATRPLGLLTHAVHLNAWTPDGRVYLALRSATKQTDPNMWDTLVGGLLNMHDTPEQGLVRECYEEAGLLPEQIHQRSPIRLITRVRIPLIEGYQVEDILTSDCILAPEVYPQNVDGEVSEIAHFAPSEVLAMMEQGLITTEAKIVLLDSFQQQTATTRS